MILYKYFDENRVDVLKTRTLRFTQPIFFNDPFEFLPVEPIEGADTVDTFDMDWGDGVQLAYRELKLAGYHKLTGEEFENAHLDALREARSDVKADRRLAILCHYGNVPQQIASLGIGVLCLTERPDNLLMWSHYASECRGFVLGFDVNHDWFRSRRRSRNRLLYRLTKVTYDHKRPTKQDDCFFRKGLDWQYEQEWRMVCPLHQCDQVNEHVFVRKFPGDCVVSVLLGCRMRYEKRIELMKLARRLLNMKLSRTYPSLYKYKMMAVPYERAFHIPYFSADFYPNF